ncbi:PEP-utilizing enzyme [Streptomyces sediminimaris]|uniref:PEP-utilizing enzyme n=1 Tax=Streptomyces sediminimaris TaxID=3383721 RepID=UPI00399C2689
MTRPSPQEYFRSHSALADWLAVARPDSREAILNEDSTRSSRLRFLHERMGLPILHVVPFSGQQVAERAPEFEEFLRTARGAYAVRSFHRGTETVVRNRNLPVDELLQWLESKVSDLSDCDIEFTPHMPNEWATIFVVTLSGIIGEVVRGSLRQLTQGDYTAATPSIFTHNFDAEWSVVPPQAKYQEIAASVVQHTRVAASAQLELSRSLGCSFTRGGYMEGYYEAVVGPSADIRFIDFNIAMGRRLEASYLDLIRAQQATEQTEVQGVTASRGHAVGVARVLLQREADLLDLADGEVLVCSEPTPDMIPLLAKAAAVVSDRGGLLSHCSVVCREMAIPCVIGTVNATEMIQSGQCVTVDADSGIIRTT